MDILIKKWTIQLEYGFFQFDIVLTVTKHKPFLFSLYQKAQVLFDENTPTENVSDHELIFY